MSLSDPTTSEVEYTANEVEFLLAMEGYQRASRRRFPTYREVLAVLRSLGYRKVEKAGPPPKFETGNGGKRRGGRRD